MVLIFCTVSMEETLLVGFYGKIWGDNCEKLPLPLICKSLIRVLYPWSLGTRGSIGLVLDPECLGISCRMLEVFAGTVLHRLHKKRVIPSCLRKPLISRSWVQLRIASILGLAVWVCFVLAFVAGSLVLLAFISFCTHRVFL